MSDSAFVSGYTDRASIDNRANSVLNRIEQLLHDTSLTSATRLCRIAWAMSGEPILTDQSPAAFTVREEASW